MKAVFTWFESLFELFFPKRCVVCFHVLNKVEEVICRGCLHKLPITNNHLYSDNNVEQLFWGRCKIEFGCCWFYYRKNSEFKPLLHELKYKGRDDIGFFLGRKYGKVISNYLCKQGVTHIIPVPLHDKKLKFRGYNQSEVIAEGISKITNIPVKTDFARRKKETATQTRKKRFERWQNVEDIFEINTENQFEKEVHFLIVDDVVTTGSTIEAMVRAIHQHYSYAKVSVLAIASSQVS